MQARNKPADGLGHVNQKGLQGQKAPLAPGQKVAPGAKGAAKPAQKPSAQKGQVKVTPKAASVKTGKNKKKGHKQQYDRSLHVSPEGAITRGYIYRHMGILTPLEKRTCRSCEELYF